MQLNYIPFLFVWLASISMLQVLAISPFTLPIYYNDNMILQRAPLNATIWGFANTNSIVSTTIYGINYTTEAVPLAGTSQFRWTIILNSIESSNQSIDITLTETRSDGVSTLTIKNVLFGDIWFCSGQSNMQFSLSHDLAGAEEITTGSQYDQIRLLTVDLVRSAKPVNDGVKLKHKWTQPTAAILGKSDWASFSAVCWYYGKGLYKEINAPVGLIVSAWTGTNIEQWLEPNGLANCNKTSAAGSSDSSLWYGLVSPYTRLSIKGVLWYQGEQNAAAKFSPEKLYSCELSNLMDTWRRYWYQNTSGSTDAEFPFGIVQIANPDLDFTTVGYYPIVRWAQTGGYGYTPNPSRKNVFMATAYDLIDATTPDPVHPRDKTDVGARLLLGSLNLVYGRSDVEYAPPRVHDICYKSQDFARISLKSDFAISLLVNHQNGFEVCCDNSTCDTTVSDGWDVVSSFEVSGSEVTLSLPSTCSVLNQVRYNWRQVPCTFKNCSLYSASSLLPLYPFKFEVSKQCVVEEWSQCGGIGYTGVTLCDAKFGLVCEYRNDYYSECVKSPLAPNTVAEWGQCGGLYYTGFTQCDTGLVCTYQNDWYWQCLKPRDDN